MVRGITMAGTIGRVRILYCPEKIHCSRSRLESTTSAPFGANEENGPTVGATRTGETISDN
jgi:hypothetical protein